MKISVIGLGKLGLPFSFFLASFKKKVFAYDKNKEIYKIVQNKKKNYLEPKLKSYIKKYNKNVIFCESLNDAIEKTDLTFLVLPTPSLPNGSFSNKYIKDVLKQISKIIINKKKCHFISIASTVNPNSCKEIFIPFLEKKGLINHKDFCIIYNPHFIAQGSTIHNLKNPDLLLIGVDHVKSKKKIKSFYKKIYKKGNIYKILNLTESEIAKLGINSYITNKITFANYISEVSEKLDNVNAVNILSAIGKDSRIGNLYLKLGTKFSGPCFPRDNKSLSFFFKINSVNSELFKNIDKVNNKQSRRIIKKINLFKKNFKKKINLGILGLTYKSDTNIVFDSQSYDLIKSINKKKLNINKIKYYDKYIKKKNYMIGGNKIIYTKNIKQLISNSEITIIMYKDKEFNKINKITVKKNKVIIDCWNLLKKRKKPFIYSQLGLKD